MKTYKKMETKKINNLLNNINNLKRPDEIAEISCVANDEDGSIHSDITLQKAIDEGTLWVSLDIYAYRTFSASDELKRGSARDAIISQIETMESVLEVIQDGTSDHVDYGNNPSFRVNLQ